MATAEQPFAMMQAFPKMLQHQQTQNQEMFATPGGLLRKDALHRIGSCTEADGSTGLPYSRALLNTLRLRTSVS